MKLNMDRKKEITGLSMLVLAQVVLFVLVYLATIALGAGLVYFAFHACIWVIPPFFENVAPVMMRFGKFGLALLACIVIGIIGLWAFIVAVGIYLIKPLFIFPKRNKDYGREIKREDSPKLFDLIDETAKTVGVKRPKHVYVNHEVNACVFFNTGFWNIFFPVRKNLVIGLGLFEATNTEEVKSILAHEFGHFAQESMRVGSVLYVANKVICDLVYRRDKLDNLMLRWCLEDGIWGFWGTVTQSVVIRFRNIIEAMFRRQQRSYMKLSRQMEYDADRIACNIVGSDVFISGLCKTQKLSKSFNFYNRVLANFLNQKQIVSDYWKGYTLTVPKMAMLEDCKISFERLESVPYSEEAASRVNIEEIWESHPSTKKRIDHAKTLNVKLSVQSSLHASKDLIEASLWNEISIELLKKAKNNNPEINEIGWTEFEETLSKTVDAFIFPKEVDAFFNRDLTIKESDLIDSPVSVENAAIISRYEQALQDENILKLIVNGKIPVKRFRYDEIEYPVNAVPLKEHQNYTDDLRREVERIDWSIREEAIRKSSTEGLIEAAYDAIAWAQSVTCILKEDLLPVRDEMIKDLNEAKIAGEGDFEVLKNWLDSYERALKDTLKSLQYREISPFMTREEHEHIIGYLDAPRSFISGIDSNAINHMFAVTDWIMRVHENLSHDAKMVVINTILQKDLPDTRFLQLWMKEEQPAMDENSDQNYEDDGRELFTVRSAHGILRRAVPTDEEIDKVYYEEWFRYRLYDKYDKLRRGLKFEFSLVATMPIKEENGRITYVNSEDKEKFTAEIQEYYRFLETHLREPNWSAISDSASNGNPHANTRMAELYLTQKRFNLAFEAAMIGALGGDHGALVVLGMVEAQGEKKDPELAVKFFKCAAVEGNMHALYNLGIAYLRGFGIEQNAERALKLFERSALQGNSDAQNELGYMYLYGIGCKVDKESGLYWLSTAAAHGSISAINYIWKYFKAIEDTDNYIAVVRQGAAQGIEECIHELDNIQVSNIRNWNPSLNSDVTFNNPTPIYDTTADIDACPICGKGIDPGTSVCPHCKEIICEE